MSSSIDSMSEAVQNIRDDLRQFKHDKWGWVIYRCSYDDDQAWIRFEQIIKQRSRDKMARPDVPPEVAAGLEWTFVSDRATLDGISRDQLRRRFRAWATEAKKTEQPRASDHDKDWNGLRSQRYTYFVQVDREALRSVVEGGGQSDRSEGLRRHGNVGWVSLVRADEEQDFDNGDINEGYEHDDDDDAGWIKISANMLGPDFYDAIGQMPENWYAFYSPPPAVVLY
jgi:hypothetical protein